jgi:hypothetical protein
MCRAAHDGVFSGAGRWLDDVLESVGPCGHFLAETSTRGGMRSDEWFVPRLGTQDAATSESCRSPGVVDEARRRWPISSRRTRARLDDDIERD